MRYYLVTSTAFTFMAFLRRLLFYAIGIGLGILIVLAFFGDRDFDYAHGPQARVKKNFRTKVVDSTTLVQPLLDLSKDSLYYRAVVDGRVAFGASEPQVKSLVVNISWIFTC